MKKSELRTQSDVDLAFQVKEARTRIFDLRFKASSEELADTKELRRLKRTVARILTIQGERARAKAADAAPSGKETVHGR